MYRIVSTRTDVTPDGDTINARTVEHARGTMAQARNYVAALLMLGRGRGWESVKLVDNECWALNEIVWHNNGEYERTACVCIEIVND